MRRKILLISGLILGALGLMVGFLWLGTAIGFLGLALFVSCLAVAVRKRIKRASGSGPR